MDGDSSAKAMDKGAASAMSHTEGASGIHETAVPRMDPAGQKTTGAGTSAFDAKGGIGSMFKADGALGGTAQAVGGPLDKQGAIGKHFNADGKIGGTVQDTLGKGEGEH